MTFVLVSCDLDQAYASETLTNDHGKRYTDQASVEPPEASPS